MAKGSGNTRVNRSNSTPTTTNTAKSKYISSIKIEEGYDREKAQRIIGYAEEILKEEGIKLKELELVNRKYIDNGGNNLGNANIDEGIVRIGNVLGNERGIRLGTDGEFEIVAHEIGHHIPVMAKPVNYAIGIKRRNKRAFENPEKYPGVIANYERNKKVYQEKMEKYNKNKALNDKMNELHKEFMKEGRHYAFSDYAYRGGFGEFVAEAFAKVKINQRREKAGHVINERYKKGFAYRAYEIMKQYPR